MNGQAIGVGTAHRYFIVCVLEKEGFAWLVSCELPILKPIISIAIFP